MNKKIKLLALTCSLVLSGTFFASADTVTHDDSMDCMLTGPVDTVTCVGARTTVTYTNPQNPGSVLITLESHEIGDFDGFTTFSALRCSGNSTCLASDVVTQFRLNNVATGGTITRDQSSGSITPTLTAGDYYITMWNSVSGASNVQSCVYSSYSSCTLPPQVITIGNTLTVNNPPASVNLDISYYIQEVFTKVLALLGIDHSYAQTTAVNATSTKKPSAGILVANINLTDAQVTKISTSTYNLSFTLTNKGETQSEVHYATLLVDEKGKAVSTHTYKSQLTLERNTPFTVREKLVTPRGLQGTYGVRVQSFTASGLPLGFGDAGKVTLVGNETPSLTDCTRDKKSYEVNQILTINCDVRTVTKTNTDYVISSQVFLGSEPTAKQIATSEIVGGKAKLQIKGLVPPGEYTIHTSLYERNGTPVGKEITETFTVKGTSVSILNLLLDKDIYKKGEEARVAASFSIFSTEKFSPLRVTTSLFGKRGECASTQSQALNHKTALEFSLPVIASCANPVLTVQVVNDKNVVVAQKTMRLITTSRNGDMNTIVGYGFALLVLLMATGSLIRQAHRHGAASIVRRISKGKK